MIEFGSGQIENCFCLRMLIGPWCSFAWAMQDWMEDSEEMSPVTVKRFGLLVVLVIGRRSWAVTLQPWPGWSQF